MPPIQGETPPPQNRLPKERPNMSASRRVYGIVNYWGGGII